MDKKEMEFLEIKAKLDRIEKGMYSKLTPLKESKTYEGSCIPDIEEALPNDIGAKLVAIKYEFELRSMDMAKIMNVTPRNYLKYEKNEVEPSTAAYKHLSVYTGISVEWLLGLTEEIYRDDFLQKLESFWLAKREENVLSALLLPESYLDLEKRRLHYTLPLRANILFLFGRLAAKDAEIREDCTLPFEAPNKLISKEHALEDIVHHFSSSYLLQMLLDDENKHYKAIFDLTRPAFQKKLKAKPSSGNNSEVLKTYGRRLYLEVCHEEPADVKDWIKD